MGHPFLSNRRLAWHHRSTAMSSLPLTTLFVMLSLSAASGT